MTDRLRVLQIIWLSLMGGVALFATVAYVMLTVVGIDRPGLPPSVMRFVGPAAVVVMMAGLLVRHELLEAIPRDVRGDERIARYHGAVLVGLAIIEGCGLFIIVLSLVSQTPSWIPAGTVTTLLMMVLARPRREEVGPTQ